MRIVLATCLAVLALAAPAGAAVSQSAVTQPADLSKLTLTRTQGAPGTVFTVAGTSNGTSGDPIDIRCYERPDFYRDISTATVGSGGNWQLNVDGDTVSYPYAPCILRAVPPGSPNEVDPATYAGPRIEVVRLERYPSAASVITDAGVIAAGALGFGDIYSAGSCGPCDMALFDRSAWKRGHYLFYGNADLWKYQLSSYGIQGRSTIDVDGHPAYAPTAFNFDVPGRVALGIDGLAEDRLDTTEAIKRCSKEDTVPANGAAQCENALDTGVQLIRTARFDDGHRRATVTDTWRSIDGGSHRVQLFYEHYQNSNDVGAGERLGYEFPWVSDQFVDANGALVPAPPPGPTSIFVQGNNAFPNGSFDFPVGSIVLNPAPDGIKFRTNGDNSFLAPYYATVAPGRDFVIVQQMTLRDNQADLQATTAASANALQAPTVTIASPANGSTIGTPTVRATGIAVDNGGTPALKVNGVAVPVGADGTWTTDLPVSPGAATITAEATDAAGNTSKATTAFTVDLGADRKAPTVKITGLASSVRLKTFRRSGLRPRVQCTNEACSINGQLLGKLSSISLRVDTGYAVLATKKLGRSSSRRTLALKPSSRFMRAVRRGKRLKVVIVATDAAGNNKTTTRTVRIK